MALRDYSNQGELFGPSPELLLPAGHYARAIDDIVERLGLERVNRKYEHTPGEPAYDVRMLVKVLIFAYLRGITSSREMARQCEENIAFRYLTHGQCPDFRTISLFRRKRRHLLRWVFKKTVQLARQMGIARLGLVALDSVKLPANASAGKKMTRAELADELRRLEEYLAKVEASDRQEDSEHGEAERGDELPAEVRDVQKRKERLEEALQVLKERQAAAKREPPKDVSIVDPEAPWVKKSSRFVRGYSGQVVADSDHQVIVAVKATAEATDSEQLNPILREVEKTTGKAADQLVADSGYYTDDAVLEASRSKTDCIVPDSETAAQLNNPKRSESDKVTFHASGFTYDEAQDEFTCPQGKRLPFVRNHEKRGQATKVYRCADCHDCPFRARCTEHASGFRSIELRVDHAEVRKLREKLKTEIGKAVYKKRKAIVEPIFGRWQHNWGIRRLRLRGLAGFSAELHLMAIAHNMAKLFRFEQGLAQAAAKV
jgi:transposase